MRANSLIHFSQLLRVLAHPIRLRIVELLLDGECDVTSIGQAVGLEGPPVSQHLALLRAHRLVDQRRVGQRVFYKLSSDGLGRWLLDGSRLSLGGPVGAES